MRARILLLPAAVGALACFDEPTPPRGIQIGGTEYNMNFTVPSPVRVPTATGVKFFRTVAPLQIVDSLIVTATGLKELVAPARYQLWVVNGLTGAAWPVRDTLRLTRTDTAFTAGAVTTSQNVTNRFAVAFFEGAKFNTIIRFKVSNGPGADTIGQSGSYLVLTIQADSSAPAFTATTPKIIWMRFRDQRGTPAFTDDTLITTPVGVFGTFRSDRPDSSRVYQAQGFGRSAFWDRERDGVLVFSALAFGLPQPPIGYFYQPYARDTRTGAAASFGRIREKVTDSSLAVADLVPAQGTLVQLPDVRFGVREDSLACTFGACGAARFTSFTAVHLVLEPKLGDASYPNLTVALQGTIPTLLTTRRPKEGIVSVAVMNGSTGVFAATVVIFGAGTGAIIASKTTNPQGVALFTAIPSGPIDVRVYPPSPLTAPNPQQRVAVPVGDTVAITFAVQ